MKVSRRTDYALRILFHLVEHSGQGPLPLSQLAQRNDVPRRFLEHIMLDLKKLGWVDSTSGRFGGYVLAKSPTEITMGQVVRHFDGVLAPIGCVSVTHFEPCSQAPRCRFRRVFLEIRNQTARIMDAATLASVYAGEPVTKAEVFSLELTGGSGI